MKAGTPSVRLSRFPRLVIHSIEHLSAKNNLMKSQVRSEIGSRFGRLQSFGPQSALLSSQRVAGSQRRVFAPRKTFTFHGSRRKTNVSVRSLGNSLNADASHRRKLTPSLPTAIRPQQAVPTQQLPTNPSLPADPSHPAATCIAQPLVTDFAVPLVEPQVTLAQHMVTGPHLIDAHTQVTGIDEDAKAARASMPDRPFLARRRERRRMRQERRPKPIVSKPFRKIFYSEKEGKWIEHRIFESEPKITNELSGPQPFPKTNAARRRRPQLGPPHKVKGRKTSKMREMLPTAFVKGGDKPDQPCRKIEVTDQLRMELYKRNMPVVPTFYQEHIYRFGKPPFRGNPRNH